MRVAAAVIASLLATAPLEPAEQLDVVVRGGTLYDGTGGAPAPRRRRHPRRPHRGRRRPLGGRGQRPWSTRPGLAVAPGFINMLSWSTESLLVDGRSQGEIRQGVTTQIFGEGESLGPWTEEMKKRAPRGPGRLQVRDRVDDPRRVPRFLEKKGVSPERGLLHRRRHRPRARHRPRRPARPRPPSSSHARPGAAGDGGGRPRHRLVADLRAGHLRHAPRSSIELCKAAAPYGGSTSRTCAARATGSRRRSTS